ncbi:MNIO family bufferin maturase [Craterilacuibacter sp.]|uniref:MNIO family bufferin maturase n=1 Tax=Craterilacuibacter sp. TaxID=2870909 RepID=UPI003F30A7A7
MLSCGIGLKPQHFEEALAARAQGLWFEVHAENYMADGGPRLAWLARIRAQHPLSLHGVGLSLAGAAEPDTAHLARLVALAQRIEPVLVSEHLAWSAWRGNCWPDLLPVVRTRSTLARLAANIGRVQDALGRTIAIEHPAHYLALEHEIGEIEFLTELAARSGCQLLIDVNNVFVGANNLGYSAGDWIDAVPVAAIAEIHLAGHSRDPQWGEALLIDSHDMPVSEAVWDLYARLLARSGPRPTLLERDGHVPAFASLLHERERAHDLLGQTAMAA